MLLASLSFRAQPHKRGEILSAVDEAVSRMRRASGCERCRLLVDTEDPNAFERAQSETEQILQIAILHLEMLRTEQNAFCPEDGLELPHAR